MSCDQRYTGWDGRRVLVTGATGFLGHHVALALVQAGSEVRALVRSTSNRERLLTAGVICHEADLRDSAAVAAACHGCEYVFHLAGVVHFGNEWAEFRCVNVDGTRCVLEAARGAGVRRVVHTSSIVAVGARTQPTVLDEQAGWNLDRLSVPYVTTKREAETLAIRAAENGFDVVVVNPASVVGPDDFSGSAFGTLCRRFWRGRIPVFFGRGNCFVDVRDVARGHLLAAQHGRSGERYILGGENLTYRQFFQSLAQTTRRRIFRVQLPEQVGACAAQLSDWLRPNGNARRYLTRGQARLLKRYFYFDSGKARCELGYHARPLAASLADAYRFWFGQSAA